MKSKTIILSCLIILVAAIIYFTEQALQKNGTHQTGFSGEWKSKEPISMGGNIVCTYVEGDRMLSNRMKIAELANYLTVEVPNPSSGASPAASREKLTFDGKESQINYGPERGKKFTAKLSADRRTMTVKSVVHLMVATPYHVDVQKQMLVYVTEVWKLSNDGKTISIQANAKSNIFRAERSWKTVFNRTN